MEHYSHIPHVRSFLDPVFLAPGTDFVEDKFSTDWGQGSGFRTIQDSSMLFIVHFISNLMLLVI